MFIETMSNTSLPEPILQAGFSTEQKEYLAGLFAGVSARGQKFSEAEPAPQPADLIFEERVKRELHPLDAYSQLVENAMANKAPDKEELFRFKWNGLFFLTPVKDAFMARLRIPGGVVRTYQLRELAKVAQELTTGYVQITTRANFQIRLIQPKDAPEVLHRIQSVGLHSRGSGGDNIRNLTANPTAGIDPVELINVLPFVNQLAQIIINDRSFYDLPRKFNIAFDGGGRVASLEDTNDIGFRAVSFDKQIVFRVAVGGITGHGDFAGDLGVAIPPERCLAVALAIVRTFIDEGDRADRKKARLKYVLDRMGRERFLGAVEQRLPSPLPRVAEAECAPRPALVRGAHVGFHAQTQPGLIYCGVVLPLGKMTAAQMRALADIAERYGSGTLRLTVWQNVLVSDIRDADRPAVETALRDIGLSAHASEVRAGLVACTGNTGCKFAASDTKRHALAIADYLDASLKLDTPINIHLTGCPHSCAQHYIGDLGLLGAKIAVGEEQIDGYHLYAGGGFGERRALAREILRDVPADRIPAVVERLLRAYVERRASADEPFQAFAQRHSPEDLRKMAA